MNASYSFIENVNDFFSTGYFTEDFHKKVFDKAGYSADGISQLNARFSALRQQYNRYKQDVGSRYAREKDKQLFTHDFNTNILKCLGYYGVDKAEPDTLLSLPLGENGALKEFPVRTVCSRADNTPQLYVMDIATLITVGDEPELGFAETGLDRLVSHVFAMPEKEHPRYILLLSGNKVFFMDADKWNRGAYLQFDIERLLTETTQSSMRNYFALFYLLVSRDALANTAETPLMEQLEEESYKNAYSVTQDLKLGVVSAVEDLANEAIWYIKQHPEHPFHQQDETDDNFEAMMRDDCLTYIYRLLFIFYAESRPDLDILPINDKTYQRGYSLEMLRDLEQVNMITAEEQNGYFFDYSIKQLFKLILGGYNENRRDETSLSASFRVRHLDSPLFSEQKLKVLKGVQFRNLVWQRIICQLSLSQQQKGKARGRISYANLGINQLGSVYENLLAYRGFYAEEDYIEVHPVGDTVETYLVPRSRRGDFNEDEILKEENGTDVIYNKGRFIYRLNGRDRKKSASYYTPEVLTKSTVKYTLRPIVEKLEKGELSACDLMQMKILEPAMGAAAFQNEAINQIARLYLQYRQKEVSEAIDPLDYPNELQKTKAFIATNNVYGVDLNATAIELGKLSLWLNVMHRDMETPFFSNRLAHGNAVIGAWLKVYKQTDVQSDVVNKHYVDKKWWEASTRRLSFDSKRPLRHYTEVYHFLLPVKEMLGVLTTHQRSSTDPEYRSMKEKKRGWLKGITGDEYTQLKRISNKIDVLLKEYVKFQMGIEKYANNGYSVWNYPLNRELPFNTTQQRQELDDRRYGKNSAYRKLKAVMDYWCSLFFWEYEDAASLPTRQQYWDDIERVLNVDVEYEHKVRFSNADKTGQQDLFLPKQGHFAFDQAEEESEVKAMEVNEILSKVGGRQTGELQLEGQVSNDRFDIVTRLSERYRFFHPMLDFLEVFWLRDGFDIICGNPPWIKLEFNDTDIVAEKFPEVAVRRMSAPDVRRELMTYFVRDDERKVSGTQKLRKIYHEEENENVGSTAFLNAYCNYPLLVGQQTNLYKCVLANGFSLLSNQGYMGLLHPETVYDDSKGQPLRKEMYKRLCYHFQFQNALNLFAEVAHREKYGSSIYGGLKEAISFDSINNLFHPNTIDLCFTHNGNGECHGIKENGEWNLSGHKDRIVHYDEVGLRVLCDTFEEGGNWECTKLVSIHAKEILDVLKSLSSFKKHVRNYNCIISEGWHETNDVDKGIIKRSTQYPDMSQLQMIYSGPHMFVGNPLYKTPKSVCIGKADYNVIDLNAINTDYISRTNYTPCIAKNDYEKAFSGFQIGQDDEGNPIYDNWIDYYKSAFRLMLSQAGERTLSGGIIPPRTSHICTVISAVFPDNRLLTEFTGLTSSLTLDFFVKTIGTGALHGGRILSFPLGIADKFKSALFPRTLMLNCLTSFYSSLWNGMWEDNYCLQSWSINDSRLKQFNSLQSDWTWNTPLRNYFERRQALVEIDVITAMALGLSLQDLEMIYTIQFPVLQQNEDDTWYDAKGNIVFTCSKGLTGVGLDRQTWETIRGEKLDDNNYAGIEPTSSFVIDPAKSELYGGETVTYYAPYNRQNRIEDYRRAWEHFEKVFKD
ncbi:MAG: type II restriction endonuclease subunit M [Prevotella sp.]|jgi:hypothetical protein|nr:type II restriction endonuclease subunit M [Prevotella sp.]MBE6263580.1 type II restriction endonuclease subunit M [Prevotella sp.]